MHPALWETGGPTDSHEIQTVFTALGSSCISQNNTVFILSDMFVSRLVLNFVFIYCKKLILSQYSAFYFNSLHCLFIYFFLTFFLCNLLVYWYLCLKTCVSLQHIHHYTHTHTHTHSFSFKHEVKSSWCYTTSSLSVLGFSTHHFYPEIR